MFSLENFYLILHVNLIEPLNGSSFYFSKFGSTDPNDLDSFYTDLGRYRSPLLRIQFYDQEPIYKTEFNKLWHIGSNSVINLTLNADPIKYFNSTLRIYANSEHSQEKNDLFDSSLPNSDWYYFFHGFAALDWFRNINYIPAIRSYSKVFISFNNIVTKNRSYRLNLIARLMDKNLHQQGHISMNQDSIVRNIKDEIFSTHSRLSTDSKKIIVQQLLPDPPVLTIDHDQTHGALSADDDLETLSMGLFHLVTETIFYDQKLHLTEKIFKPIVARRPFFLVAAPGNLAYLKSYGFKTFDRWIDESYDNEPDHDQRIIKIVNEVERLCKLTPTKLDNMYQEMQEVLDYNFNWFYSGFKKVIVDELVDNFKLCIDKHNIGLYPTSPSYIDHINLLNYNEIKNILSR